LPREARGRYREERRGDDLLGSTEPLLPSLEKCREKEAASAIFNVGPHSSFYLGVFGCGPLKLAKSAARSLEKKMWVTG